MKKVIWVVFSASGQEISRHSSKKIANCVAHQIGGHVSRYAVEG